MNETIDLLYKHHSVRSYTSEPVDEKTLDTVLEAAWRGPTSSNAQVVSVVVTRDPGRKAKIAEIAGGQKWIAEAPVFLTLVADFNKTSLAGKKVGKPQTAHTTTNGLLMGAVDAGIALGEMMVAARALGLGIVPIGAIRRNIQAMIDLLGLPPLTFPIVGLTLGHIAKDSALKPRLSFATFKHEEHYNAAPLAAAVDAYDAALLEHWKKTGREGGETWSASVAAAMSSPAYADLPRVLEEQGFVSKN